jgi:hypothetical protein
MNYHIFKMIDGVGLRFLASAHEPYQWVTKPRDAKEFADPERLARMLDAQYVEVEDLWAGPGNR